MNIKALIKKYEAVECVVDIVSRKTILKTVLRDLEQLDEPEKVKVKQFVADWYEENKDDFELNLWLFLTEFDEENIDRSERFGIWLGDEANNPIQTLVNMHQFGYEVEKEKQYAVKIKVSGQYLAKTKLKEISFMYNGACSHFTRKELEEAGFGWVFDCPGIEIEEVE
ncbi:DUF1642 domain-containing protein [Streptococcus mitis]|uniref:DUF1642 domain-containing protein n=1 Tax=Streptococcus mitis TaxID=28037 RepID=UPI001C500F32|nr:hypothetical protein MissB1_0041 [Streptococcus phage MissB1]UJH95085.1 hypothetical protein MissG1_0036 [Streptococcus phage MissG1]